MAQRRRKLIMIHRIEDVPSFESETDEAEFWDTHVLSDELLDQPEVPVPEWLPPARHGASSASPAVEILAPDEVDLTAAARLISDAFLVHPQMNGRDRIDAEGLREQIGDTGELLAIHEDDGLTACAVVRPAGDVPRPTEREVLDRYPGHLYFGLAAVQPGRMRQGLGGRLLARAEALAHKRGYEGVILSALREMGNVAYYEARGYEVVHTWRFEREGEVRHFSMLVKAL